MIIDCSAAMCCRHLFYHGWAAFALISAQLAAGNVMAASRRTLLNASRGAVVVEIVAFLRPSVYQ